jgi:glycosyltransferase involved in cell wall biosynthesis
VSVVVPARNAAATLPRTLAAVRDTEYAGDVEVVVVDDASADDTALLAERAGARVLRLADQAGPAAARNAGIATARGELLVFTDADCFPAPGWLPALVAALDGADLAQGPVLPDPGVEVGRFDRTLRLSGPSPLFETANLGVRRELAERMGGFTPFVPAPGVRGAGLRPTVAEGHFGEDATFGWAARRSGARLAFAPDAVVHHAVFARGRGAYVAERWRLRYFPALVREVPELRASMPARLFLSARTMRFDAALLGAALAAGRRSPVPLALAAPYLWRDVGAARARGPGAAADALAVIGGDLVGAAALLRGSLAARRLLL